MKKIKTIDNKIKQSKGQYNLDRKTTNILALSSRDLVKYESLASKNVLSETDLLEKVATIKRFEYSPLGSGLKKQTDIAKKNVKDTKRCMNLVKQEIKVIENQHLKSIINQI